jgi:WD40 repeat protein
VEALAFHPHLPWLAVAGIDWSEGRPDSSGPRVADWQNGQAAQQAKIIRHRLPFNPDGCVAIWDMQNWRVHRTLVGGARRLSFHPAGRFLAAATLDESVAIWNAGTGDLLAELSHHELAVADLAFDPTGQALAVAGADGGLWLWDTRSWELLDTVEVGGRATTLAFAPDGRWLHVGGASGVGYALDWTKTLAEAGLPAKTG